MRTILPWDVFWSLLWHATLETLYMVSLSSLITIAIGLLLGILLFITGPNSILPHKPINLSISLVINIGRSLPFIILLIAVIPLTRLLIGSAIGSTAAIVPLTLGAIPFFARIVESALNEIDKGRIEALQSMGATPKDIIRIVLIPEALPSLIAGITLLIIMLIGFSSMAGVIGGGGLGDLAHRYGYQRFNQRVMLGTVFILIVMVQLVQYIGERAVRALAHRR